MMSDMVIQFICRGNAFRSIIAEAYMNSLKIPGMSVQSSGTVAGKRRENNAANFPRTLALLERHGIRQYAKDRYADDVDQNSLDGSEIVIFLNKRAYEEVVGSFSLPARTYVWDLADIGEEGRVITIEVDRERLSEDVYNEIAKNIDDFVKQNDLYAV